MSTEAKLRRLGPPDTLFHWIEKEPTEIDKRENVFVLVTPYMFLNIEIRYINVEEVGDDNVTKYYYPFIDRNDYGMYSSFEEAEIAVVKRARVIVYDKMSYLEVELHKAFDCLKEKNYERYVRYSKGIQL